jgi:hypothetical protein
MFGEKSALRFDHFRNHSRVRRKGSVGIRQCGFGGNDGGAHAYHGDEYADDPFPQIERDEGGVGNLHLDDDPKHGQTRNIGTLKVPKEQALTKIEKSSDSVYPGSSDCTRFHPKTQIAR